MTRIIQIATLALALITNANTTLGLEPALAPDMAVGTSITFEGPKGNVVWVLESREDDLFHWRSGAQRWVKRTNFDPTVEWSNSEKSGSNEFTGSHAGLYPLEEGKSSKLEVTSSTGRFYHHTCTVGIVETITVPLGTFPTYPVDCKSVIMKTGKVTRERVYYYSPQHRFFIRRTSGRTNFDVVSITP
ncbi:MAG: hypothetical protein MI920_36000 [Kiloniellales bacterium]|nr:hypothetical protein [Kiloniellales bacterium]